MPPKDLEKDAPFEYSGVVSIAMRSWVKSKPPKLEMTITITFWVGAIFRMVAHTGECKTFITDRTTLNPFAIPSSKSVPFPYGAEWNGTVQLTHVPMD